MQLTAAFLSLCTLVVLTGACVPSDPCQGPTQTGLLPMELPGSEHAVMAAYREHRQDGAVRVLAMVHMGRPAAVDCVLCCSDGGRRGRGPDAQCALRLPLRRRRHHLR